MKLFRKTLFWFHLVVGLVIGLEIALLAGTGLLMSFEHPIVAHFERYDGRAPTAAAKPLSAEQLLTAAATAVPDATPTGLTAPADLDRPVAVQFGRDRVLYLNGYTARPVGTEATRLRSFFATCLQLHRWLALQGPLHEVGQQVSGVAAIGLSVLVLSGLWLWVPRRLRWSALKPVLVPHVRKSGKTRDWNWHNVAGLWFAVPLLVFGLTGTMLGYDWASGLLFRAAGETPPARRGEGGRGPMAGGDRGPRDGFRNRDGQAQVRRPLNLTNVNDLWGLAEQAVPGYTTLNLRLGGGRGEGGGGGDDAGGFGGQAVTFTAVTGDPDVPWTHTTLTYDRFTGELLNRQAFADQTLGRRLRSLLVPVHRGEALGNVGRAIAAGACGAALLLVYTGFALSYRRLVRPVVARVRAERVAEPVGEPVGAGVG